MTRIIEAGEDGSLTLPPDALPAAEPHARYVVETDGERVTLRLEPAKPAGKRPKASSKQSEAARKRALERWERESRKLTEELSKVWPPDVSVVDVIADMRR